MKTLLQEMWVEYNIDLDLPLMEMANYDSTDTNIGQGIVYISTRYDIHGCRVQYVFNWNDPFCLIVAVPSYKIVVDTLSTKIDDRTRKEVIQFAMKNEASILKYWDEGLQITNDQRYQLSKSIQPLTDQDKRLASSLTLTFKKSIR